MSRNIKITNAKVAFLNNLTKAIEDTLGVEHYLITEQEIANKYKVSVEEVIIIEKEAILLETEEKNAKLRRAKILKNLYKEGLDFYKEVEGGLKSDFTDAIIVNGKGEILFLKRANYTNVAPGKYGLPAGHLEKFKNIEANVIKEVKEETGLDTLDCKLISVRSINEGKNKIYYFFCTLPLDYEIVLNEKEHTQYKWMSLSDIKNTPDEEFMFDLKQYLLQILNK